MGKPPVGDRILTTMLMTDIARSTDRVSEVGDVAWDQLLDRHHALVREILEHFRGTEIDTAGDGFLTMFDGAARAVQAALAIRDAVRGMGLDIRAGVHTGEVEVVPGGIRGLAVHETARIMALGAAGEILVSGTTRELSAGSGFVYEDRGIVQLKASPRRGVCSRSPAARTRSTARSTSSRRPRTAQSSAPPPPRLSGICAPHHLPGGTRRGGRERTGRSRWSPEGGRFLRSTVLAVSRCNLRAWPGSPIGRGTTIHPS